MVRVDIARTNLEGPKAFKAEDVFYSVTELQIQIEEMFTEPIRTEVIGDALIIYLMSSDMTPHASLKLLFENA